MEKYCISVDWLSVCCYGNQLKEGDFQGKLCRYHVRLTDTHTSIFQCVFEISVDNIPYAVVTQSPRSSALKQSLTILKLTNRVLWSTKYVEILYDMFDVFSLKYKGITRIDICYDCNKFYSGRQPARFIRQFITVPMESKGAIYRIGSEKFALYGGKSATSNCKFTGIKFGSPNNDIVPYIYDKTLELSEVKDKPWIREVWSENGLISDEKTHVWRAEISIKSKGKDLLNMQTGQLFSLSPRYLEHYENIVKLFHYYAAKVFDFRLNNGVKCKKNFDKLQLFDTNIEVTCKPYSVSKAADTGRSEKVCYNKLRKLSETYTDLSEPIRSGLEKAMDFISHLAGVKLSTTKARAYERYLDSIKGCRFMDDDTFAYLETLDAAFKAKREINAEGLWLLLNEKDLIIYP